MINFLQPFGRSEPPVATAGQAPHVVVALAPADITLPPAPRRCHWLRHEAIAALTRVGAPAAEAPCGQAHGVTLLAPQPVCAGPDAVARLLAQHAAPLRRILDGRRHCAEYRIIVSGAAEPADTRLFARLAQDMADLSRAVRATERPLLPIDGRSMLMALSLMLPNERIPALLEVLETAQTLAEARGLTLHAVGPDAMRSFPVSLSDRAELVLEPQATA